MADRPAKRAGSPSVNKGPAPKKLKKSPGKPKDPFPKEPEDKYVHTIKLVSVAPVLENDYNLEARQTRVLCTSMVEHDNTIKLQLLFGDGITGAVCGGSGAESTVSSGVQREWNSQELWDRIVANKFNLTETIQMEVDQITFGLRLSWQAEHWLKIHKVKPNKGIPPAQVELFYQTAKFFLERQVTNFPGYSTNDIKLPTGKRELQVVVPIFDDGDKEFEDFFTLDTDPECPVEQKILWGTWGMNHTWNSDVSHLVEKSEAFLQLPAILRELVFPHEGNWVDPDGQLVYGDRVMTRYFFNNNGTCFIDKVPGKNKGYKADLSFLRKFSVREKYYPYGGIIWFDENAVVTHIDLPGKTDADADVYTTYRPNDELWEFAKLVMRSSAFIATSGVHLIQCHLNYANYPNYAMRSYLSCDHPIRKLLHPHFWRSAMVARKSLLSLVPENGLLHRGTGFTVEGLHGIYKALRRSFKFETYYDELERRGMTDAGDVFPLAHDAPLFHQCIDRYVGSYVDIYYKRQEDLDNDHHLNQFWDCCNKYLLRKDAMKLTSDNLKVFISELIFRVTGWHQHIGNAIALVDDPSWVSLRLVDGESQEKLVAPLESFYVQGLVTELTTMPMPTLLDQNMGWRKMFEGDHAAEQVFDRFISDLKVYGGVIAAKNQTRTPFTDLDPTVICCSVSS